MSSETIRIGDRRIEYRWFGSTERSRTDIVLLHEGLGSVALWRDFPASLAVTTGRRVLACSRHGYGRSSALTAPRTPDYMHAEAYVWLPRMLDALEVRRYVLYGHSDGASIALIHGSEQPAGLCGIIATAPHLFVEDITVTSIEQARLAYQSTDLRSRLAKYHEDVDSAFVGWNSIWLSPAFRDWNIESLIPQIAVPVLAIQGIDDEYGTLAQIEALKRLHAATELLVLEDCRHSPHVDRPAEVIAAVNAFVAGLAGGP